MFSLKNVFNRYHFATRKIKNVCKERKRLYPYVFNLYVQNLGNIAQMIPKSDLNFTAISIGNYAKLNLENAEFEKIAVNHIK
jgi:hypothetical protein